MAFNDINETVALIERVRGVRDVIELAAWTKAPEGSEERSTGIALSGALVDAMLALERLQDEVTYWRRDAAARLRTDMTLARAAERLGEEDRAAEIRVNIIFPTRAALANALSGDIHWPLCEGCGKPIQDGDAVFAVGDEEGFQTGELHAYCDRPQLPDPLPDGAYRYADDPAFSPEGIAKTLAEAQAFDAEDGEG